ncbi:MAG: efflux RND transporter periplasmic adaptor subunit [Gammaproteobacteria bacterium]
MTDNETGSTDNIGATLGLGRKRTLWGRLGKWSALAAIIAAVAVGLALYSSRDTAQWRFQTAEARRGDLTVTVTATGTLQPVNQVDVGTEVSGTVERVAVDFNDRVKRGEVLAQLDTDQLSAKLRQSQAALELARAKVQDADATLIETRLKFKRLQALAGKGMSSKDERDAAEAAYARARASLEVAKAQVTQAQAQVDADRTMLDKAVIRSPIDGIVLKRQVEPGQTVAASLQTPVLFTLAENLKQMELDVAVDEADVGQVKDGQHATFTVDAFPDRRFPAVINQVRYAPQTVQGVVTYEAVLAVDNSDLSLRPGMTATAEIVVKQLSDVLLVPNAALRFAPPVTQTRSSGGSLLSRLFPRPRHATTTPREASGAEGRQRVWILSDGRPVAVPVTVGASDGQMTEVLAGKVSAGTPVLVDAVQVSK